MSLTYNERQELNEMSKEVFGTSSRWQKMVDTGIREPMERTREVMVPKANGTVVKKTFTDRKSVIKHFSVPEIKKFMQDIIAARSGPEVTPVTASVPSVQVPTEILFPEGTVVNGNLLVPGTTITNSSAE